MLKSQHNLKKLTLLSIPSVNFSLISNMLKSTTNLTYLCIRNTHYMWSLFKQPIILPHLEHLELEDSRIFTELGFVRNMPTSDEMRRRLLDFSCLQTLIISDRFTRHAMKVLTDSLSGNGLEFLPSLRAIKLSINNDAHPENPVKFGTYVMPFVDTVLANFPGMSNVHFNYIAQTSSALQFFTVEVN